MSISTYAGLVMVLALGVAAAAVAASWRTPVIENAGRAAPVPDSAFGPEDGEGYRVVFDISTTENNGQSIPGLEHLARYLNLMALEGVEPTRLQLVGVVHGEAARAALSDEAHAQRYGGPNPHLDLARRLSEAGVTLFVCGQTLAEKSIAQSEVASPWRPVSAAMIVSAGLQGKGWAALNY